MKYTEIKGSGIRIPEIIFGTSALGNLYHELEREVKQQIIHECLNSFEGPVAFDTAGKYGAGLALEELGLALSNLDANPGNIIISNKLGWLRVELTSDEPSFEKGVWMNIRNDARLAISRSGIFDCWEQGNRLLGSGFRPKMLSVHDPDEYLEASGNDLSMDSKLYRDILDAYKTLSEIKSTEGQIAIGIGAKNWKVIRRITNDNDLDWVMIANSMSLYDHPSELVAYMDELMKRGIFVINSALFNAGFLTGGEYFNYRLADINDPEDRKIYKWRDSFFRVCNEFSVKPSHACIQFGLSHPAVTAVALNTSNPAHVRANVEEVLKELPTRFFGEMKNRGLIDPEYPYV